MTASSDSQGAVAGGLARHIPVLVPAAVRFLNVRDNGVYLDATFGGGGYSREILSAAKSFVIGIDRDASAIARGAELARASDGRLVLMQRRFSDLRAAASGAGYDQVDGVVFDVGVSSMQLDDAGRGFSFRHDGPLDMRMGDEGPTAADVLASIGERDLARIIATLGEERHARRIARALVRLRASTPIRSTRVLAQAIAAIVYARPGTIHPATRTFQALRIFVNDELAELLGGLCAAEQILKPGGRLVVVAFHSLEDRIVKSFLAQRAKPSGPSRHFPQQQAAAPTFKLITKRPIVPDEAEVAANPRARSAKLRAAERTEAEVSSAPVEGLLPPLPSISQVKGQIMGGGR
jgi:16S rRNA (cytosine1402-N4)-methyltransferase